MARRPEDFEDWFGTDIEPEPEPPLPPPPDEMDASAMAAMAAREEEQCLGRIELLLASKMQLIECARVVTVGGMIRRTNHPYPEDLLRLIVEADTLAKVCCFHEVYWASDLDRIRPEFIFEQVPALPPRKPVARADHLFGDGDEPLVDEYAAGRYLDIKPITALRLAHRGTVPSIPFPIGTTGKFRHKFQISALKAYVESLSRSA